MFEDVTRLAVDIGGTFTDVVLEGPAGRRTIKVLTDPVAPESSVMAGVREALQSEGLEAHEVGLILHGTTLATNAIIERRGAATAFITTEGFRDIIEVGYESRYNQYDLMIDKVTPLIPRHLRLTVPERSDVYGRIVTPLDEPALRALLPQLERQGINSVAVGFLHSYANPTHERRVEEILREALPSVSVTLSSDVCPEVREFERFTTTTANAYVRPLMEGYLTRLETQLSDFGVRCPILLMTSGGGLTTLETAKRHPIRLVESGPAGGVVLAREVAAEAGLRKAMSFDMGGTTAKICFIEDFEPKRAREFEVDRQARFTKGSGLPLRIPVVEMVEIGAGGGSIARVDALGRIVVGPDSAGADPGPAAYDRGGRHPTITDTDIVLGRIDPDHFADGKIALRVELAAQAVQSDVAEPLGLNTELAAFGVCEMVDETMSNAARVLAVEQGKVASEHTIIAFGGAAPLHACRIAEKLGIQRIVVPADAGVGSAVGFLRAPVAYEVVRSLNMRLSAFDADVANRLLAEMAAEAYGVVESGAFGTPLTEQRLAFMRYLGQGHEITVPIPLDRLTAEDRERVKEAYDVEYRRLYKRTIPDADIEILSWGLTVSTAKAPPPPVAMPEASRAAKPFARRQIYDAERSDMASVALFRRSDLDTGATVDGPALITEDQTTTFITAGFRATMASNGNIVIERARAS